MPVRLYHRGEPNQEVLRIIEGNTRVPHKVLGDLRAQRIGCLEGERRVLRFFEQYGEATVSACVEEILSRSEAAVREVIARIPPGEYAFEDYLDDCGRDTGPIRLKVVVRLDGSDITIDFTGTDPQTVSGLNSTLNFTRSYCYWFVKAITTQHHIPQNEGQLRPLRIVAPEGCLLNPRRPAAGGPRAILNHRLTELLIGALAPAIPHLATAANSQFTYPTIGGIDPRTSAPYVFLDVLPGGLGGYLDGDGAEAMGAVFSMELLPIEVVEASHPLRIECLELITDSAGPGQFRGGCGLRKDIRVLGETARFSNLSDRHRFPAWGLFGGKPGALAATVLNPGTPDERPLHSKGSYDLRNGDVVSTRLSGAGGYGEPMLRDPDAVLRDVVAGLVSVEAARDSYGVVVDCSTLQIDRAATDATRRRHRAE
jgi:N-methylhydantoinase B